MKWHYRRGYYDAWNEGENLWRGRVVIPVEYRKSPGLKEGDELTLRLEQGELRMLTSQRAIKNAQGMIRQYLPKNRSLTDELIAERREYENE